MVVWCALVAGWLATAPTASAGPARWRVDTSAPVVPHCILGGLTRIPGTRILWMMGSCTDGPAIAMRWTPHGGWSVTRVGTGGDLVLGAAVAPGDVWALGQTDTDQPLVMHWDGHTWSQVATPDPGPGVETAWLSAMTAVSPNDIWAVGGTWGPSTHERTLVEHWNGDTWQVVATPHWRSLQSELHDVFSVPGHPNLSWAVGQRRIRDGQIRPLLLRRRGTRWSIIRSLPHVASGALYSGVSTGRPGGLWLVGIYDRDGGFGLGAPLVYRRTRNGWRRLWVASRLIKDHAAGLVSAAVIPATNQLWAVGGLDRAPLTVRWDGTDWDVVRGPTGVAPLDSVIATSRRRAWAVGGDAFGTLIERYR